MGLLVEKVKSIIRREENMKNSPEDRYVSNGKIQIGARAKRVKGSIVLSDRDKEISNLINQYPSITAIDIAKRIDTHVSSVYNSINKQQGLKEKRMNSIVQKGMMITCTACGTEVYKSVARIINHQYFCSVRCAKANNFSNVSTPSSPVKEKPQKSTKPTKTQKSTKPTNSKKTKERASCSVMCAYCQKWNEKDQYTYNAAVKRGQKLFFCNVEHYGSYRRENPIPSTLKTKKDIADYPVDTTDFNRLFSSLSATGTDFNIVTPWAGKSSVDVSFMCNITLEELNMSNVVMLRDVILGPPQVTDYSMIDDLQNLGVYGLYQPVVTEP